jgi:hypothetical protein
MIFNIFSRCVNADDAFDTKYTLLNSDAHKDSKATIDAIYFVLSVLDTKSSALMRLDGVVLAAAFVGVTAHLYEIKSAGFGFTAFPCMISMIICLTIVGVDWPFLGNAALSDDKKTVDFTSEITELRKVRRFREGGYRVAWFFALISALSVLVVLVHAIFFRA